MKTETHSGVRIRNYVLNFNERIPSIDSTINISRENRYTVERKFDEEYE